MAHRDEYGTGFRATFTVSAGLNKTTPLNLTGATIVFLFRKPSGEVIEKEAEILDARKGIARYVGEIDFLDETGMWEWQPRIEMTSGLWYGQLERFQVDDHLSPTA